MERKTNEEQSSESKLLWMERKHFWGSVKLNEHPTHNPGVTVDKILANKVVRQRK